MSQHPEDKGKKSSGKKSESSGKASNLKSGHGNAREKGAKK